jgi:hypothetical protein
MNKYLLQLAQDLTYIRPDKYKTSDITVYDDVDVNGNDCSEYVLYIRIPEEKEEIAAKAIDEVTRDGYWYDICYQTDTDKIFVAILGDGNKENITNEIEAETLKIFKDFLKNYKQELNKNESN